MSNRLLLETIKVSEIDAGDLYKDPIEGDVYIVSQYKNLNDIDISYILINLKTGNNWTYPVYRQNFTIPDHLVKVNKGEEITIIAGED